MDIINLVTSSDDDDVPVRRPPAPQTHFVNLVSSSDEEDDKVLTRPKRLSKREISSDEEDDKVLTRPKSLSKRQISSDDEPIISKKRKKLDPDDIPINRIALRLKKQKEEQEKLKNEKKKALDLKNFSKARENKKKEEKIKKQVTKTEDELLKNLEKCILETKNKISLIDPRFFIASTPTAPSNNFVRSISGIEFSKTLNMTPAGVLKIQILEVTSRTTGKKYFALVANREDGKKIQITPQFQKFFRRPFLFSYKPKGFGSTAMMRGKPGVQGFHYYYHYNLQNRRTLQVLLHCVRKINDSVDAIRVEDAPYKTSNKEFGILEWDVRCDVREWIRKIIGTNYKPRSNPIKESNGRFRIHLQSVSFIKTYKSIKILKRSQSELFKELVPLKYQFKLMGAGAFKGMYRFLEIANRNRAEKYKHHKDPVVAGEMVSNYFNDEKKNHVLSIGWAGHARSVYVDGISKNIYVFDPWMQKCGDGGKGSAGLKVLQRLALHKNYKIQFVPTQAIQAYGEGSCVAMSLIRSILLAMHGPKEGASMKLPCDIVILVYHLLKYLT